MSSETSPSSYVRDALNDPNVPASGSTLTINGQTLYLDGREVVVDDNSELTAAVIELTYQRRDVSASQGGSPTLSGEVAVQQIRTQIDPDGNPITVTHTWAEDDKGVFADGTPRANQTETQGGTIDVYRPQVAFQTTFSERTSAPVGLARQYVGKVNGPNYVGAPSRTIMCTAMQFELVDASLTPPLYQFRVSFAEEPNTWDDLTTAVFIDPSTGKAPPDVVVGEGIVQIPYYQTANFAAIV